MHTKSKKCAHKMHTKKKQDKPSAITELSKEEIEALKNEELTDKQRLFCLYYTKTFNATRAYQKAYGCDYQTSMVNGTRMLRNAKVKDEIIDRKTIRACG